MNNKNYLIVLCIIFSLSGCYINSTTTNDYVIVENNFQIDDDHVYNNNYYLFNDMETLKQIIIPKINKSFTYWHWNAKKFDEKYKFYYGNIAAHELSSALLDYTQNEYCVYNGQSERFGELSVSGSFYVITELKTKKSTIFYVN